MLCQLNERGRNKKKTVVFYKLFANIECTFIILTLSIASLAVVQLLYGFYLFVAYPHVCSKFATKNCESTSNQYCGMNSILVYQLLMFIRHSTLTLIFGLFTMIPYCYSTKQRTCVFFLQKGLCRYVRILMHHIFLLLLIHTNVCEDEWTDLR